MRTAKIKSARRLASNQVALRRRIETAADAELDRLLDAITTAPELMEPEEDRERFESEFELNQF